MVDETPQSISFDLGRTNLTVNQRCGNCKHLKRLAHPAYGQVCKELGMLEISKPCARFSADPTKIKVSERAARLLVESIQELSDDKLELFASILIEEKRTRRFGFKFGQVVYLNVFGGDYISNYRRMKVVSATRNYVNLIADEGFTAMVYSKNVLSSGEWQKKKKWLQARNRLQDPNYKKYIRSVSTAEIHIRKIKDKLNVLEFDSTSKHDFSITKGMMDRGSKLSDPSRTKAITSLIRVR